jgi:hypothetical protein
MEELGIKEAQIITLHERELVKTASVSIEVPLMGMVSFVLKMAHRTDYSAGSLSENRYGLPPFPGTFAFP